MAPVDLNIIPWREAAACRSNPDVDFFPAREDSIAIARARAVCAGCPVQEECLSWALLTNQPDGIWGGRTPKERRAMRRHLEHGVGRVLIGGTARLVTRVVLDVLDDQVGDVDPAGGLDPLQTR